MNTILDGASIWSIEGLVRMTLVAVLGLGVLGLARRASAATRHLIAVATLAMVIALPAATAFLPDLALPVLPERLVRGTSERVASSPTRLPIDATWDGRAAAKSPASASPAPRSLPPMGAPSATLVVWLLVTAGLILHQALSAASAAAIAARAAHVTDETLLAELRNARARLGLRTTVALKVSSEVAVPAVLGLVRPTLVLPRAALGWDRERIRVVFLHELAHVGRRDGWSLVVTRFATAVAWFHPLVWMLARGARRDCERACDDVVLAAGVKASTYAEHLLAIVQAMVETDRVAATALSFAMPSNIELRLSSILRPGARRDAMSPRRVAVGAALAAALLIPLASARLVAAPARSRGPAAVAATEVEPARLTSANAASVAGAVVANEMDTPEFSGGDGDSPPTGAWKSRGGGTSRSGSDWFSRGRELYEAERFDESAAAYMEAASAGYRAETAYYNAACSFARARHKTWALGALGQALDEGFDRPELVSSDDDLDSIREDPRFRVIQERAMNSSSAVASRNAARARYEALLSENSDASDRWKYVAKDLLRLGDYERAADAFQKQFDSSPDAPEWSAIYNLACAHALGGHRTQALDALERAITQGTTDGEYMVEDSDLASLRGDARFRSLVDLATDLKLYHRGSDDDDPNSWRKSLPHFEDVARRHPTLGRAWFNLGYVQLRDGGAGASLPSFQRALTLGYRPSTTMYDLACASAQAGQTEAAFQWLERAEAAGMGMEMAANDKDLEPLHADPRFRRFRRQWEEKVAAEKYEKGKAKNK